MAFGFVTESWEEEFFLKFHILTILRRKSQVCKYTHRLDWRLCLRLSLPRLNALFLHCQRSRYIVELIVEPTGIAHRLALAVAAPQCCRRCITIVTAQAASPVARCLKITAQRRDTKNALDINLYILNQLIQER